MGFFRNQQIAIAKRLILWQYEKKGLARPSDAALAAQAAEVVDHAHKVARERGKNVLEILRDLVNDLFKKDEEKK